MVHQQPGHKGPLQRPRPPPGPFLAPHLAPFFGPPRDGHAAHDAMRAHEPRAPAHAASPARQQLPLQHEARAPRRVCGGGTRGWNSHRKWEALAAGAVPLVDAHAPLAAAFAGPPAVHMRDWAAVTPPFLAAKREELQRAPAAGGVMATKAYWPYCLERLTAAQ